MSGLRIFVAVACSVFACVAQQAVNPHSALLAEFSKHVDDYMNLHKTVASKLPQKSTTSQDILAIRRTAFAAAIREGRPQATQGELFTPAITEEFKRLVGLVMQGNRARRIRQSMNRAEPVHLQLKVNDSYPEKVPLQTTPPSLLMSLPRLPPGLEYRVIGHDLVLRDADANVVVDFAPDVIL